MTLEIARERLHTQRLDTTGYPLSALWCPGSVAEHLSVVDEPRTDRELRVRSIGLTVALIVSIGVFAPVAVDAGAEQRLDIHTFMTGLACTESGGRFDAVNKRTGAYGKYQIMPRNWIAWSGRYLGNRWAQPTPRNQEFVARQRVLDLFEKRGEWRRVAYWWLTGNGEGNEALWSDRAFGYVERVMSTGLRAARPALQASVAERCFPADLGDPKIRTEPFPRVWVTGGRVNVRIAPGYENRAVDYVRAGMRLSVLAKGWDPRGEAWLKVGLADGEVGWIKRSFTVALGL